MNTPSIHPMIEAAAEYEPATDIPNFDTALRVITALRERSGHKRLPDGGAQYTVALGPDDRQLLLDLYLNHGDGTDIDEVLHTAARLGLKTLQTRIARSGGGHNVAYLAAAINRAPLTESVRNDRTLGHRVAELERQIETLIARQAQSETP